MGGVNLLASIRGRNKMSVVMCALYHLADLSIINSYYTDIITVERLVTDVTV